MSTKAVLICPGACAGTGLYCLVHHMMVRTDLRHCVLEQAPFAQLIMACRCVCMHLALSDVVAKTCSKLR